MVRHQHDDDHARRPVSTSIYIRHARAVSSHYSQTSCPRLEGRTHEAVLLHRLVANLTVQEKAGLFVSRAAGVERIGWKEYNWWSESLHGVARDPDAPASCAPNCAATSFPQIGLVACSLNRSLWHAMGDVTSTEGRGKNNPLLGGLYQGLTFWAPNVNIYRDPVR